MSARWCGGLAVAFLVAWVTGAPGQDAGRTALEYWVQRATNFPRRLTRPVVTDRAIWVGHGGHVSVWEAPLYSVYRVDPRTRHVTATVALDHQPVALAAGGGAIWVQQEHVPGSLVRIDEQTLEAKAVATVGCCESLLGRSCIAFGEDALWVAELDVARAGSVILYSRCKSSVLRLDPRTGAVLARIPLPRVVHKLAAGAGGVWALNCGVGFEKNATVWRIDPATNQVSATIAVPPSPTDLAVGEGLVWLVHHHIPIVGRTEDSELTRIDPQTNQIVGEPLRVPGGFGSLAVGRGAVWLSVPLGSDEGDLYRIDARTGRQVGASYRIPNAEPAVGPLGVWVSGHYRPKGDSDKGFLVPLLP